MKNRKLVATVAAFSTLGLATAIGIGTVIQPAAGGGYGPKARWNLTLSGANEVGGGDSNGAGFAVVNVKGATSTVCVKIKKVTGLILPATMAHIHQGNAGTNGPIVLPLNPPTAKKPTAPGKSKTCAVVNATLLNGLLTNPTNYYVNVHTTDHTGGAIRAQLYVP
jgi:hypothetical protein